MFIIANNVMTLHKINKDLTLGFAEISWRPLSNDALYTPFTSLVAAQQILSWLSSTVVEGLSINILPHMTSLQLMLHGAPQLQNFS